jgi:hypothetical protein
MGTRGRGFNRIDHEVEQDLLELFRIALNFEFFLQVSMLERYLAELRWMRRKRHHGFQQLVNIRALKLRRSRRRKIEKPRQ